MEQLWTSCRNGVPLILVLLVLLQLTSGVPLHKNRLRHHDDECTECPPGHGVVDTCNQTHNTWCSPCPQGHYSRVISSSLPCLPCSQCGGGLFELYPCISTEDVFCELCSWTQDLDSHDYQKKCVYTKKPFQASDDFHNPLDVMLGDQALPKDNDHGPYIEHYKPGFDPPEDLPDDMDEDGSGKEEDGVLFGDNQSETVPSAEPGEDEDGDIINDVIDPDGNEADYIEDDLIPEHIPPPIQEGGSSNQGIWAAGEDGEGPGEEDPPPLMALPPEEEEEEEEEEQSGEVELGPPMLIGPPIDPRPSIKTSQKPTVYGVLPAGPDRTTGQGDTQEGEAPVLLEVQREPASVGESKEVGSTSVFPIFIAAFTSGVIFFAVGFFLFRPNSKAAYSLEHLYQPANQHPTENDYQPMTSFKVKSLRRSASDASRGRGKQRDSLPDSGNDSGEWEKMPLTGGNTKPTAKPGADLDTTMDSHAGPPVGKHQSPIDINPDKAELDEALEKTYLVVKYVTEDVRTLQNTGATVVIHEAAQSTASFLTGGPFGNKKFRLHRIEFRWGSIDTTGSEHKIRGHSYSGEVQFIHWNADDFSSFEEASKSEDGLAALAVFLEVAEEEEDTPLSLIANCLPSIQYKNQARHVPDQFNPDYLLPGDQDDYWTYQGSLTSAPYYETVTWVIFKETIPISHEQMERFRQLRTYVSEEEHKRGMFGDGQLVDNFRSIYPVEDRLLRASFP